MVANLTSKLLLQPMMAQLIAEGIGKPLLDQQRIAAMQ
jgi:hypothetical protein